MESTCCRRRKVKTLRNDGNTPASVKRRLQAKKLQICGRLSWDVKGHSSGWALRAARIQGCRAPRVSSLPLKRWACGHSMLAGYQGGTERGIYTSSFPSLSAVWKGNWPGTTLELGFESFLVNSVACALSSHGDSRRLKGWRRTSLCTSATARRPWAEEPQIFARGRRQGSESRLPQRAPRQGASPRQPASNGPAQGPKHQRVTSAARGGGVASGTGRGGGTAAGAAVGGASGEGKGHRGRALGAGQGVGGAPRVRGAALRARAQAAAAVARWDCCRAADW